MVNAQLKTAIRDYFSCIGAGGKGSKGSVDRIYTRIALRFMVASLLTSLLASCDEVYYQIDKVRFRGTHMGVSSCTERFTDSSLNEDVVKSACIRKNEVSKAVPLGGNLAFGWGDTVRITACNESSDFVITRLGVHIAYGAHSAELDLVDQGAYAGNKPLWIAPNACEDIYIHELLNPRPGRSQAAGANDYFSWRVNKIHGVTVYAD